MHNSKKDKSAKAHIMKAKELANMLLSLSQEGIKEANDNSCLILFGTIRDCAFKIQRAVEEEIKREDM